MKLLFENWRKYLNEASEAASIGDEIKPPYSSVVLDAVSSNALLSNVQILDKIKELGYQSEKCGTSPCAHHMTITMGPLDPKYGWEDGQQVGEEDGMIATHLGWIDEENGPQAIAVKVTLPAGKSSKNLNPHVTVAIPVNGKPFHSNKIINWDLELKPSIPLIGKVVGGAETQTKKEKPKKQQKPQGQANPVEFAKSLAGRGLQSDKIKDIIMNKFNKPEAAALGIMRGAGIQ